MTHAMFILLEMTNPKDQWQKKLQMQLKFNERKSQKALQFIRAFPF